MKKLKLLIILMFFAFCESANAKQIYHKTAHQVANNFYLNNKPDHGLSQLKGVQLRNDLNLTKVFYRTNDLKKASLSYENEPAIYIFCNPKDKGFVITSAETSMPPILGYSYENTFNENNIPPQLKDIIERWIKAASDPETKSKIAEKNNSTWEALISNDSINLKSAKTTNIEPLIKTKWGQGQFYNDLCPEINGSKAPVGCMATAVSQIMKYWNFPEYGTGKINYDMNDLNISVNFGNTKYEWANMPEVVSSSNNSVATLCFQVGAAIGTSYGFNQSAASVFSITKALNNYFNYSNMKVLSKAYDPEPLSDYESIISVELFAGRPVLFAGSNGSVGHSYICDGMQNDLYHLNFGWDGNSDGFYNLSTELEFNIFLTLIYDIKPSKLLISEKNPLVGESISIEFLTDQTNPNWSISPKENVTIENDAINSKLKHLNFSKLGLYKISLLEIDDIDTIITEENTINVAFSMVKRLAPTSGIVSCGQSWPVRWFDYDNDGDLDLYCGYTNNIYENVNGTLIKKFELPSSYNGSFQVLDYNNDSFLDIIKTESSTKNGLFVFDVFIYKNMNGLGFEKQNFELPSLGGGGIIPRDFNNDGLIDLFIYGDNYYENSNPENEFLDKPYAYVLINHIDKFEKIYEGRLGQHYRSENMATANDFDNDGDIDILVRSTGDTCMFLENAKGSFIEKKVIKAGGIITSGDIDNNGTMDLISTSDRATYVWATHSAGPSFGILNIGYNADGEFKEKVEYVNEVFEYNRSGIADFNSDGKSDMYITRTASFSGKMVGFNVFMNGNENNYSYEPDYNTFDNMPSDAFRPEKDDRFSYIPDNNPIQSGPDADCGDFNNDGYPDVAIGSSVLRNAMGANTFTVNSPPTAPTDLHSTISCNKATLTWGKANDGQTPANGLSYNLMVGTTSGGTEIMSPMSDISTGKRKIVAMGNAYQNTSFELVGLKSGKYYWSVQAVDNGYMGGKFASINYFEFTEYQLPAASGTISGSSAVCQGQNSVSYTVPAIANTTSYIWTLPTGATGISNTNSITVKYSLSATSGNITVKGYNDCGDGAASTLLISVNPLPITAGTIIGTAAVCQGQRSVSYTVPAIANATSYIWTLPTGATGICKANSITVYYSLSAASGNITVKGHNDCGDGAASTLLITVKKIDPLSMQLDSLALVALYNATDGPNWTRKSNWLTGPIETWQGVTFEEGRVVKLNLGNAYTPAAGLVGTLPAELSNLTAIREISMERNQLSGSLPDSWSALVNLQYLYLDQNQLTGNLPSSWSSLVNLQCLVLMSNQLTGTLPASWSSLVNLQTLVLNGNQLTGSLPDNWSSLIQLSSLALANNKISGIPDFSSLTKLISIDVSNNLLDFGDIEPNISVVNRTFNYSPQALIGESGTIIKNIGQEFRISVTVGGSNNKYQWYKNGVSIAGANGKEYLIPSVTTGDAGNYTCQIINTVATELTLTSQPITLQISNQAPIANAGNDQSVNERATVSLDGSASSDPDGNPLTYKWTAPAGITLISTTIAKPNFTAPEVNANTNYTFSLVVNDGMVDSPVDQVVITVQNVNKAPIANTGLDQSVNEGATVSLDGSASSDPDGNLLTYKWTAPTGITLSFTTIAKPTFTAPEVTANTNYTFSLVVNDGTVDSPVDQVAITVLNVNKVPIANAGPDQSVNEGATVSLDGSTSSDPDGNSLTYKWTAPAGITLSSATAAKPTFTAPEVTTNTNYTFSLVVNDGTVDSPVDQVVITVKDVNKPSVANAGPDQSVNEGATVSLDGSASSDPDDNPLTYKWNAPAGISLSSTTTAKPTFMAPEVTANTNYTFSLVVNDGTADSPVDQIVVTVRNVNKAPVASAGTNQSVNEGATVSLDGSASSDPDGNSLTYKWIAPDGIILSSTTAAKPTFTAPEVAANANYTFSLVVNDGTVDSPADQVVITVKNVNKAPTANAGIDQSVNEGATVSLDGSASSDPDGNPLTYKWTAPAGITLSSATAAQPTFTASEVTVNTNYTFSLVVNDGTVDSPVDQVVITVQNVNKPPVANAGIDQSVNEGATVSLDGSTSSDPDENPLTYKWTAPTGITLSSISAAKPTFTAPEVKKDSIVSFSLLVNDGYVNSTPATVKVTILNVIKVGVLSLDSPFFKIYPNPTTAIVNVEITGGTGHKTDVVVMSLVGTKIFGKEITDAAKFQIDLSNQISGMYLLIIKTDNQQYISKIIVSSQK